MNDNIKYMRSICDACSKIGGGQATTYGKCSKCGCGTVRDFAPVYTVCKKCFVGYDCVICGEEITTSN